MRLLDSMFTLNAFSLDCRYLTGYDLFFSIVQDQGYVALAENNSPVNDLKRIMGVENIEIIENINKSLDYVNRRLSENKIYFTDWKYIENQLCDLVENTPKNKKHVVDFLAEVRRRLSD